MKEIARAQGGWILSESASGELWLSVHCGMVASFEINMRLNAEECFQYRAAGSEFIERLAAEVASHPGLYQPRHVPEPVR